MGRPKVLVLASGDNNGGGSGFQELVEFSRVEPSILSADIVGVISNHEKGGVYKKAKMLGVNFVYWDKPFEADGYRYYVDKFQPDFVMCSGWLPFVRGLDARKTVNIHPGPLPKFGGKSMWGHHVHEAVMEAYRRGEVTQSAVSMHFIDEVAFDHGPLFFQFPIIIRSNDTAETLGNRVNEKERAWQAYMLDLVVHEHIKLAGSPDAWTVLAKSKHTGIIPGFQGTYI
jgi:phosphoribosylglycinamide formyltransferase-1